MCSNLLRTVISAVPGCYVGRRSLALLMPLRTVPPSVGSIFDSVAIFEGVMYKSGLDGWVLLQQGCHPPVGVGVHSVDPKRVDLLVGCDLDVDVVDVGGVEGYGHGGSILRVFAEWHRYGA